MRIFDTTLLSNFGGGSKMKIWLIAALVIASLVSSSFMVTHAQEKINPNDLIIIGNGEFSVDGATKIDIARAKELHEAGTVFVDARDLEFFNLGHIPGAILLNFSTTLTEENLAKHVEKDQTVVFYCEYARCFKSAVASAKAVAWGYMQVQYFANGMKAWEDAGYPIVTK
jgi:rhodanese-related sulfurtransferase